MDAGHTDLLGELIEDLLVSGDEQDVEASLTELLREGLSDTGSATSDDFMKVMRQCQILEEKMLTSPFSFLGSEGLQLQRDTTHEYPRNPDSLNLITTYAGTSECKGFRKEGNPGYNEFGEDDRADESQKEGLHRHIDDCEVEP